RLRFHQLGLNTDTGILDNSEGGGSGAHFFRFRGPSITHLLTGFSSFPSGTGNSGISPIPAHSAGATPGGVNFGGETFYGADDTFNAKYSNVDRTIVPETVALMLK